MPEEPRSVRGVLARWRDRLLGTTTDQSGTEQAEKTTSPGQGDEDEPIPPPSLDNVLREAAQRRDDHEDPKGGPTPS